MWVPRILFSSTTRTVRRTQSFIRRVLRHFLRNHGVLLAGGVGYNVLLSAIPLLALLGVLLTHVVPEGQLMAVMHIQARHFASGYADLILDAVQAFMDSRDVIGLVGIPVMLIFSSAAFRGLEDSIAIIFQQPDMPLRSFWVSAAMHYVFIAVLGIGMLALTLLFGLAELFYERPGIILYPLSFVSVFILFSAIYKVLPIVSIALPRAVIGGFVAAVLWEGTRLTLMYYMQNVSFVNVIYGSLATIIILLITLEIGAIILLLGAQVIAELEKSARAGVPWYQAPPES